MQSEKRPKYLELFESLRWSVQFEILFDRERVERRDEGIERRMKEM